MTRYHAQEDNNNAICPYCGGGYQVDAEDYLSDSREETCDRCGKLYLREMFVDVVHRTCPDCALNGVNHEWGVESPSAWHRYRVCRVCGKIEMQPRARNEHA